MPRMIGSGLSRREREILDALHREHPLSAAGVLAALAQPPSYSAVRSLLRVLESKGHVRHEEQGKRYLYSPTTSPGAAAQSALHAVVRTFFGGSLERAVQMFLSDDDAHLSEDELSRLSALIEDARRKSEGEETS